ncbi:MAG: hypothetical protein PHT02_00090 [Tissierellia bacterium]|nr:hypothetical protein [Tissierellia bacterium]
MINELKQSLELLQSGLNEHIYLRKALMTLSKYYRYRGYDKELNKKMLIEWVSNQNEDYYGSKYYRYSWDDILKFIDEINDSTYKNNYKFIDRIEVPVTLGEMREINMLKNKGDKIVAFAMIFLSKVYNNENGEFYCSYDKISKLVNMSDRQVRTVINNLAEYSVIKIIRRNHIKKSIKVERGYKVYKNPNVYKILLKSNEQIIYMINDEKYLLDDFYNIYKECVEKHNFKISKKFKSKLYKFVTSKVISI